LSSKGNKSCTIVEDDGNILQTIDGDESLVGVVLEVQERTPTISFGNVRCHQNFRVIE
jgi:hypothetical protein